MSVKKYDPVKGVSSRYYLEEVVCFGDFEVLEDRKITYVADTKEELVELCRENGWHCRELDHLRPESQRCWHTHFIKQRSAGRKIISKLGLD